MATLETIENLINNYLKNNEDLKNNLQNIQLFSKNKNKKTCNHYYPIKFSIDEENNIRIKNNNNYDSNNIYIGSKKQFFYKRYPVENITNDEILLNPDTFKTAWNQDNFLIFLNGYLLNKNNFIFQIPGFNNEYIDKKILSSINISNTDILDIFYIESNDDFHSVPLASYNNINQIVYTANYENQTLIKIPYPGIRFKKNIGNEFYIFNDKGQYLKSNIYNNYDYDYTISDDGNYITLTEKNKLINPGINALYFTFPNMSFSENIQNAIIKNIRKTSNTTFIHATSINNENNILTFRYNESNELIGTLKKENILLFDIDNDCIIEHNNFEIESYPSIKENIEYYDEKKNINSTFKRQELKLKLTNSNSSNTDSNDYCIYLFIDSSKTPSIIFNIETLTVGKTDSIKKSYDKIKNKNDFPFLIFNNKKFLRISDSTLDLKKQDSDNLQLLYILPKILYNIHTKFIEVNWSNTTTKEYKSLLEDNDDEITIEIPITYRTGIDLTISTKNYLPKKEEPPPPPPPEEPPEEIIDETENNTNEGTGENTDKPEEEIEEKKEIDTTREEADVTGNFLFFINNIHIPSKYITRVNKSGDRYIHLKKEEKKIKNIVNKIKDSSPSSLNYTLIYLKDTFIMDDNLISQYINNNDYINIQFKEIETNIDTYINLLFSLKFSV